MPNRVRTQPDLADIVALARALDVNEQRPTREVSAREKRIAQELPGALDDRVAVALAWLEAVERDDDEVRSIHRRAETAIHLTSFLIALAGILLGWGTTLTVFYFDGSERVNAVAVLAILVALPGLLLVPYVFAALPPSMVRHVPGMGVLAALARTLSPGRLAPWLWRVFPRDLRDAMTLVSGRMKSHQQLYASLQKWALLRWSQLFAVAFQFTALVASFVLVVFTDLAFGWSTTLTTGDAALDAQRVHRVTSLVAAPWAWTLDEAQPSLALIEESRYYRVASEPVSRAQAARLGGWWRFVILTIAAYGLFPRIITLVLARSRLRAAARAAVITAPGVSALLRQIHRAQIETRAIKTEASEDNVRLTERSENVSPRVSGTIQTVVNWSEVSINAAVLAAEFPQARVFAAGGAASVQDDIALTKQLGEISRHGGGDVLVIVKAWEPPLMEFIDFLKTLRSALASGTMILVLPVGLDASDTLGSATPAQLKLWRGKLAGIGDPWLRVTANREEVAS